MNKMPMCRICLVENVRMYIINDKDLQQLYEKLTDIPFVTEDSRPMLACFICCTKLKQCCQLQRKCLEAEKLFAQMMNEPNLSVNRLQLKYSSGLIVTPVENISIVDVSHIESIAVKEELPAVCERLDDVIEPEEEHLKYELELEPLNNSCSDAEDIPAQQSKPDPECNVPLIEIKVEEVEEEQEVSRKKRRASDATQLELELLNNSCSDVEDIAAQQSKPDPGYDVPLIEIKTEVEEEQLVSGKRRSSDATRAAITLKRNLLIQGNKLEDAIKENQKNEESVTKVTQNTQTCTSKLDLKTYELIANTTSRGYINVIDTTLDTNCHNNIKKRNSMKRVRGHTGEKPFKCEICQSCFSRKDVLTRHIRTHTGEKPYKCEQCQLCFKEKCHLTRHIRTHTGEKPFKCKECRLCFIQKNHLTEHIRTHTGEKPYKCEQCDLYFNHKTTLTIHIRTHTGEKPYKCTECLLSFSQKGHLTRHMDMHKGEKPYKCEECQRCFSQKNNLINHIRTHTGEKPYKCKECQLFFSLKGNLTKHIRCVHAGEKRKILLKK